MKYLLTILCFGILVSSGFAQTMKSLMYNTNGVVAYANTNALTFTNAESRFTDQLLFGTNLAKIQILSDDVYFWNDIGGVAFALNVSTNLGNHVMFFDPLRFHGLNVRSETRTNLGATVIGDAVFTASNAVVARQALGLQSYTNTLTNSVNNTEIGGTVNDITIGWTIAPTDATYTVRTLEGAGSTNTITNNSATLAFSNLSLTGNTTWTLTVGDGLGITNTATTSVNFLNYMSWGRSTNTTLDNAAIQTLHTTGGGASRAFATSRSRSFTMDGGGQYIYIAYPAGFGSASFTVGGLPNTAFTVTTNTYTNASGYATNYLIYRTDTIQNGSGINFVVQ